MEEERKNPILLLILILLSFISIVVLIVIVCQTLNTAVPSAPTPITAFDVKIPIYGKGEEFPIAIIYANEATQAGGILVLNNVYIDIYDLANKLKTKISSISAIYNQNKKVMTMKNVTIFIYNKDGKVVKTEKLPFITVKMKGGDILYTSSKEVYKANSKKP